MAMHANSYNQENAGPNGIVAFVLVIVSLALVALFITEAVEGPVHKVQATAGAISSPIAHLGAEVAYAENKLASAVEDAMADSDSLSALREENAQLKAQLVQYEEYRLESERLRELLDMTDSYKAEGVTGRVIGRSANAWDRVITLNVGTANGVETGLCVMGSVGLVGQVIEVSSNTCKVRLINDAQSGVSSVIQGTRALGVTAGSIEGVLYLENVDPNVEVYVGDPILTSGLGGVYPPGIVIGSVASVGYVTGTSERTIVVTTFGTVDPLEELTVVFSIEELDLGLDDPEGDE